MWTLFRRPSKPRFALVLGLSMALCITIFIDTQILNVLRDLMSFRQQTSNFSSRYSISWLKLNAASGVPEEEVKKVVFIKLMKVAGTTLQEVLYKYGRRNSLKVADFELDPRKPMSMDMFGMHATLQEFLSGPVTVENATFLSMLREPKSQRVSMFYWKHRETPARALAPEAENYRFETPGNFSKGHLEALRVYVTQDQKLLNQPAYQFYKEYPIHNWFGSSTSEAWKNIDLYNFSLGFTHEMDKSLVVYMHRLNWKLRDILYCSVNERKHLELKDWPKEYQEVLEETFADDFIFYEGCRQRWHAEIRKYGEDMINREAESLTSLQQLLIQACESKHGKTSSSSTIYTCMLLLYDSCLDFGSRGKPSDISKIPGGESPRKFCSKVQALQSVFRRP